MPIPTLTKMLLILMSLLVTSTTASAQFSGDDAYDPFADYSEFEAASEEEADINFFRNGRFINVGLLAGMRSFTGTYGDIYSSSPNFGLFLSYFFDLRFALQVSYVTGDHTLNVSTNVGDVTGNIAMATTAFSLKYYVNTQNVTRGLAALNPYLLGGMSRTDRTVTVIGQDAFGKDTTSGIDLGVGIEIPLSRNEMFIGVQAWYYRVTFGDENQEMKADINNVTGQPLGVTPTGDILNVLAIFGVNF